jgi:hypothetical protein
MLADRWGEGAQGLAELAQGGCGVRVETVGTVRH